ncbi:MAG: response regulator [Acidobacteria bacterium]|nr:response regulator [Acidobacteriota bacterium]
MDTGRPKLLLADDSTTIQKVVSLTFSDEGMEVIAVGDGDQAMRQLEDGTIPDIVLADVLMPGLSGYEVCRRIKSDSRFRHIPVVLLVGTFESLDEAEARRAGADEILTKPFQSIRDLVSKVGTLLGGSESKPEAEPESKESPQHAEESIAQPSLSNRAEARESQSVEHGNSAAAPDESAVGQTWAFATDPKSSFADLVSDDQMIEARRADEYGDAPVRSQAVDAPTPLASQADDAFGETHSGVAAGADEWAGEGHGFVAARKVGEEVLAGHPAFASHLASANVADDSLLDLGGVNSSVSSSAAEADDSILDLEDDLPSSPRAAAPDDVFDLDASAYAWPGGTGATEGADAASAFNEAAHGESAAPPDYSEAPAEDVRAQDEPVSAEAIEQGVMPQHRVPFPTPADEEATAVEEPTAPSREFIEPTVVPADEPSPAVIESSYEDGSVEGDVARPPAVAQVEPSAASSVGVARSGSEQHLVGLDQLSPEAIEAIARRAVEMLSERVVQEIAWEVVPQLAELLIKRRLDEESRER